METRYDLEIEIRTPINTLDVNLSNLGNAMRDVIKALSAPYQNADDPIEIVLMTIGEKNSFALKQKHVYGSIISGESADLLLTDITELAAPINE